MKERKLFEYTLPNNTIIKIETGENDNPTLGTLRKVAKALDISITEFIY